MSTTSWTAPGNNRLKLNVDGAFSTLNDATTCGGLLRGDTDTFQIKEDSCRDYRMSMPLMRSYEHALHA